jgi:hypothetical protein
MELEIRYVLTAVDAQCVCPPETVDCAFITLHDINCFIIYNYIVFVEILDRKLPCGMPNTTRNVFSQVEGEVLE